MKKVAKKALQAARNLAYEGDAVRACAELVAMADAGSASAAASAAELLAFRGAWSDVLRYAGMLLCEPSAGYAGNVFDDMVRLVALAGHKGQAWIEVGVTARRALAASASRNDPEHIRRRQGTILTDLAGYADRNGAAPHERIAIFGTQPRQPDPEAFRSAVQAAADRLDRARHPERYAQQVLALAVTFQQPDELVRLFDQYAEHVGFDVGVDVARVMVGNGEHDRAWAVLEPRIGDWYPVDLAQVAPVVLLTDPQLAQLETPARWHSVLATTRGPAAQ